MDQFLDDLSEMERQKELRKTKVQFNSFDVISYKIQNEAFRTSKVKARGLFIASKSKVKDSTNEISNLSNLHINHDQFIACRGYDKFYNLDEYPEITWVELEQNTKGPYEVTLKENGCIIFISALGNQLLITSKHSITGQHSKKAKEWLLIHLLSTNQTESSFLEYLQQNKFTAVFELADDDFEEHVLEYSKENSGLYLHGLNHNEIELKTEPFEIVQECATKFGFFKVDCIKFDTILKVGEFFKEISATGFYKNSPIEGFVVRTKISQKSFFFKIKFTEPYLMFREWREITKRVLNKQYKHKFRNEKSKDYAEWVLEKIRARPFLFKDYANGKGIIKIRNWYLQERMNYTEFSGKLLVTPEITIEELESQNKGAEKILLVPVASIGCGKTFLGRVLTLLFPSKISQIQNDNITQKKARLVFEGLVLDQFKHVDIVYADRNNHLFALRKSLTKAFKDVYPNGKIIVLDWGVDKADKKVLLKLTADRVTKRGENHQSLTPGNTDFERILANFIYHRDAIDLNNEDNLIDEIIQIEIDVDIKANVFKIMDVLGFQAEVLDEMVEKAKGFKETVNKTVKTQQKKPRFYGVKVDYDIVPALLDEIFESNLENQVFWKKIKNIVEENKDYHMTVIHRKVTTPLLEAYDFKYGLTTNRPEEGLMVLDIGEKVEMSASKIVWNEKVICILLSRLLPDLTICNKYPHITVACLQEGATGFDSNSLLDDLHDGGDVKAIDFKENLKIHGRIMAFGT